MFGVFGIAAISPHHLLKKFTEAKRGEHHQAPLLSQSVVNRVLIKMDFRGAVENCIFMFFLLGQSVHNPRVKVLKTKENILKFVPAIVYWLLVALLSVFVLFWDYERRIKNSTVTLSYFWMFFEQITALTSFLSAVYYSCLPRKIFQEFEMLERTLRFKLKVSINLNEIRLRFHRKMMVILCVHAVTLLVRLYNWSDTSFLLTFIYKVQLLMGHLPLYHALFYIGILREFQHTFSEHIAKATNNLEHRNDSSLNTNVVVLRRIRQWRQIHYQLRKCLDLINEYFGWVLLVSCLYLLFFITWSIYWVFVLICTGKAIGSIRK